MSLTQQSPLHDLHVEQNAMLTDFGGWQLPVRFSSIKEEHEAVRTAAGVFDISHMGQVTIQGAGTKVWLNGLFTNDLDALTDCRGQYTLMCNEVGGVIDDLIIYRQAEDKFFAVFNAAKLDEVKAWIDSKKPSPEIEITWKEACLGIALQGPMATEVLSSVLTDANIPVRNHLHIHHWADQEAEVYIARTGYTGEDGVELFTTATAGQKLWKSLIENEDCKPCGLGSRDSLRLEACLPLNGQDLSPNITPLEAGLSFFVKLDKPDGFIGHEVLAAQKANGLERISRAFVIEGKAPPPRSQYRVLKDDEPIGEVTSGLASPSLGSGIGLALIDKAHAQLDSEIEIEIRNRTFKARIHKKPLYKKS